MPIKARLKSITKNTREKVKHQELAWWLSPVLLLWIFTCPPDFFVFISLQALAIQLGIVWVVVIGALPFFKKTKYIPVHLIAVLILFFYLKPYFSTKVATFPTQAKGKTFKALHLNVHGRNTQHQRLVDQLLAQKADLITLIEVNHRWAKALRKGLKKDYPYSYIYPVDNLFSGIAVFAKHPFSDVQYILNDEPPTVAGNLLLPQGKIHFISTHISAPILPPRVPRRYTQMNKIKADIYKNRSLPTLLLGDFNAVPWEQIMIDFKRDTQMRDVRKALLPTFPTWALWLGIPIDYVFYSPKLSCYGLATFQHTGSDHVGMTGEFKIITKTKK